MKLADTAVFDDATGAFTVDGEPFPWYILQGSAKAIKHADEVYEVRVLIIAIPVDGGEVETTFRHQAYSWSNPEICGIEFPWYITDSGVIYRCGGNGDAIVELGFYTAAITGIPCDESVPT